MMKSHQINELDTFILSLQGAIEHHGVNYSPDIIYGKLGIGSRFSLAMNVKTGKEIGHPSSEYIWDIISVIENCFGELGITSEVYIDGGYLTTARSTAADNYATPGFVSLIDNTTRISGPLFYPENQGKWQFKSQGLNTEEYDQNGLPFGRIIIRIANVQEIDVGQFPKNTMSYLIKTLERGEEPMEIVGEGNYSALSGWKAFARWMQAYSLPIRGIRHEYLDVLGKQLNLRRYYFHKYWEKLSDSLDNPKEQNFAERLSSCYKEIYEFTEQIVKEGQNYKNIKELYYLEQKTLPVYKEINHYLNL